MQKTLNVYLPYEKGLIAQRFGDNANPLYKNAGLKGHTAYDWSAAWGSSILNCVADAYCYSVMHKDDPDPSKYRAVFTLVETETGMYEVSYGHCSAILAEVGKTYQVGDIIAKVGNTGDVYAGGHYVTKEEKLAGSNAGAHLHGPQIRPVKKVRTTLPGKQYLSDANGIYADSEGYIYQVLNYDNGYNGCVSLREFSTEQIAHPLDVQKVASVVDGVAKSIQIIKELPPEQRERWYDPLIKILTSLANILK